MPRPSCVAERREQILCAFEACIAEDGLAGASMRKIAAKAGVKQPVIHHYFGSRDDLVGALFDRIVNRYTGLLNRLTETTGGLTLEGFLDFLLKGAFASAARRDSVVGELIAASDRDPRAKTVLDRIFARLEQVVANHLKLFFSQVNAEQLAGTAYALTALVEGHAILSFHFQDPARERAARNAAARMVAILGHC